MRAFLTGALLLGLLPLAGCKAESYRVAQIDRLQAAVDADRALLVKEAETSDPTRVDLKATFVEMSIMDIRPTSNPERPYVGHVRIRWKFDHSDGSPVGYAIWDYVYALDPANKWIKADEAPIETAPSPGTDDDPGLTQPSPAKRPA